MYSPDCKSCDNLGSYSALIHTFMLPVGSNGHFTLTIYNLITNHGIKLNRKKIAFKEVFFLLNLPLCANLFPFWPPLHHNGLQEPRRVQAILRWKM